jgi:hypothetical protein
MGASTIICLAMGRKLCFAVFKDSVRYDRYNKFKDIHQKASGQQRGRAFLDPVRGGRLHY